MVGSLSHGAGDVVVPPLSPGVSGQSPGSSRTVSDSRASRFCCGVGLLKRRRPGSGLSPPGGKGRGLRPCDGFLRGRWRGSFSTWQGDRDTEGAGVLIDPPSTLALCTVLLTSGRCIYCLWLCPAGGRFCIGSRAGGGFEVCWFVGGGFSRPPAIYFYHIFFWGSTPLVYLDTAHPTPNLRQTTCVNATNSGGVPVLFTLILRDREKCFKMCFEGCVGFAEGRWGGTAPKFGFLVFPLIRRVCVFCVYAGVFMFVG